MKKLEMPSFLRWHHFSAQFKSLPGDAPVRKKSTFPRWKTEEILKTPKFQNQKFQNSPATAPRDGFNLHTHPLKCTTKLEWFILWKWFLVGIPEWSAWQGGPRPRGKTPEAGRVPSKPLPQRSGWESSGELKPSGSFQQTHFTVDETT